MDTSKVDKGIESIGRNLENVRSEIIPKNLTEGNLDILFEKIEYIIIKICEVDEWFMKHSNDFKFLYLEQRNKQKDNHYITGFKFIENDRKHGANFLKIHKVKPGGIRMNTFRFPLYIPTSTLIWNKIEKELINPKYVNQFKAYEKYLVNKDVYYTLKSSLDFLKEMRNQI